MDAGRHQGSAKVQLSRSTPADIAGGYARTAADTREPQQTPQENRREPQQTPQENRREPQQTPRGDRREPQQTSQADTSETG